MTKIYHLAGSRLQPKISLADIHI